MDHVSHYRQHGFAIVPSIFDMEDIATLAQAADRMQAQGRQYRASFRHQNVLYVIQDDARLGPTLRFLQWPAYIDRTLARYRTEARLLAIVEPLIGSNLKQIINQLIWKAPGAARTTYAYHQDSRFRRPPSAYRDLAGSYVQSAIAIDPHREDNGCMVFFAGSHRLGDLSLRADGSVYQGGLDDAVLHEVGIDPATRTQIVLEPGDVVLWHPHIVHGSGDNRSSVDRRAYVNGYVIAGNCDRGEWAFRDGAPCALAEPQLVQYDDIYTRPEPHYIDGPPHPYKRP